MKISKKTSLIKSILNNEENNKSKNELLQTKADEIASNILTTNIEASSLDVLANQNLALIINSKLDKFGNSIAPKTFEQKLQELKEKLKNSVLDKNQNNKNCPEAIRYYYSEDFLDYILDFIGSKLLQEENCQNDDDFLSAFEEQFNILVGKTDLQCYVETELTNPVTGITKIMEENIFNSHINVNNFLERLDEFAESSDIQVSLFANIFRNVFEDLELNYSEQEVFIKKIIREISSSEYFIISDFEKLDRNNDKCWLEELYKNVHEEADQIKIIDRNTTTIDINELFKNNSYIDAQYITQNLYDLIFSDDAGTRKFAQMIYDLSKKYNVYNEYDVEELVKSVIRLINNKYCNNPLQDYRYLSKSVVETLNNNDIFSVLQEICDSDELYRQYMYGSDGLIDDFSQGTGDCWLLAALQSMCSSPIGQAIIRRSIIHNNDGSVTVTFYGMDISYTISPDEIDSAKKIHGLDSNASGDNDVIIIELAVEKLHKDFVSGNLKHPFRDNFEKDTDTPRGAINGGQQEWLYYYFTGLLSTKMNCEDFDATLDWLKEIQKNIAEGYGVLSFALGTDIVIATTINGETFNFGGDNGNPHAFSVVGMTDTTITISNPWNSDQTYTFTFEEFLKLNPSFTYLNLRDLVFEW